MRIAAALAAVLLLAGPAGAQPASLIAVPVASGLSQPVFVTSPPGDPRLFVVEQTGTIRIVEGGQVAGDPFLDLTGSVRAGGEQGLLGLAFHPAFASDGRFFINYTDRSGDTRIDACRVSDDPAAADPASCTTLLRVEQPFRNHNGGWLGFGPDGLLYVAMGDGGSGGDPQGHGQNPDSLLGKILRLDVEGGAPEVFVLGVRNPWRIAFDGDDLYIADVGQNRLEEVSVVRIGDAGVNLGWNVMEGSDCFAARGCDPAGFVAPVHTYTHDDGCSITGGYVYRGRDLPEIEGHYFFGDYCSQRVWSFRLVGGAARELTEWTDMLGGRGPLSSFGTDAAGELYMTTLDGGLFRIARG